jgi:hypothetical protein
VFSVLLGQRVRGTFEAAENVVRPRHGDALARCLAICAGW